MMVNQYTWGRNKTSMDIEQMGGTCLVAVSHKEAPTIVITLIDQTPILCHLTALYYSFMIQKCFQNKFTCFSLFKIEEFKKNSKTKSNLPCSSENR